MAVSPIFSLPKINENPLLEKLESKCSNVSKTSVTKINLRKQYFVVLLWKIYFPTMVLQSIFWKIQENIFALKASAVEGIPRISCSFAEMQIPVEPHNSAHALNSGQNV